MQMKNITGLRVGKLVAIEPTKKRSKSGVVYWLCKCDCGNEAIVNGSSLRAGCPRSCGCLRIENIHKANNAWRKHFGCMYCGSDKHYAKGCCRNCYAKLRRGVLDFKR